MEKVNYIIHLNTTFDVMCRDDRLTPFHVSLYFSLFQYWNMAKFRNPISISRDEIMRASKIGSVNTYIRTIRDLSNWNFIKYVPSYNPQKGSQVYLYNFDSSKSNSNDNSLNNGSNIPHDKGFDKAGKKATGKAKEKPLRPSINNSNNTNKLNNKNDDEYQRKKNDPKFDLVITKLFVNGQGEKKEKLRKKKKDGIGLRATSAKSGSKKSTGKNSGKDDLAAAGFKRPLLWVVKDYFGKKQWPSLEAEKFFNYYQGNGWLVGGKTPMQSWQACAANWMINSENFNHGKTKTAGKLNATTGKDYSEPL